MSRILLSSQIWGYQKHGKLVDASEALIRLIEWNRKKVKQVMDDGGHEIELVKVDACFNSGNFHSIISCSCKLMQMLSSNAISRVSMHSGQHNLPSKSLTYFRLDLELRMILRKSCM
jgi:hypothetical protein